VRLLADGCDGIKGSQNDLSGGFRAEGDIPDDRPLERGVVEDPHVDFVGDADSNAVVVEVVFAVGPGLRTRAIATLS
jgi:hypothetical protein